MMPVSVSLSVIIRNICTKREAEGYLMEYVGYTLAKSIVVYLHWNATIYIPASVILHNRV